MSQEEFSNQQGAGEYTPTESEIAEGAKNVVFKGFEDVRMKEGESNEELYRNMTAGYLKAMKRIREETGYDVSGLEMSFFRLPARSPWTIIDIYITDTDGQELKFNDSYHCGESINDEEGNKGIKNANAVDPDRLADQIYNDLIKEKEFLRIHGTPVQG